MAEYHCLPVSVPLYWLYTVVHHFTPLGRVVKKVDNAIQRIAWSILTTLLHWKDNDLSSG